jgi:hypothetical protein
MAETKTKPSALSVDAFVANIEPSRRADAVRLIEMMRNATGDDPVMWGDSIVGFGTYHYRYATGHEGDTCVVGFSPRKAEFSLYLMGLYFPESAETSRQLLGRLGKHRMGKACLYIKKLADVEESVLQDLLALSIAKVRENYPQSA